MEFDAYVKYIEGAKVSLADELSREKEISNEEIKVEMKNDERSKKMNELMEKARGSNKRPRELQFDDGSVKKIPKLEDRMQLCIDTHVLVGHKSTLYTLHEI